MQSLFTSATLQNLHLRVSKIRKESLVSYLLFQTFMDEKIRKSGTKSLFTWKKAILRGCIFCDLQYSMETRTSTKKLKIFNGGGPRFEQELEYHGIEVYSRS